MVIDYSHNAFPLDSLKFINGFIRDLNDLHPPFSMMILLSDKKSLNSIFENSSRNRHYQVMESSKNVAFGYLKNLGIDVKYWEEFMKLQAQYTWCKISKPKH
jgi:hypothetical protein